MKELSNLMKVSEEFYTKFVEERKLWLKEINS